MLACGVLENDLHLSLKSAHRYLVVVLASHLCFDYKSFYPSCRVPLLDQVVGKMITKLKLVRVVLISFTIFGLVLLQRTHLVAVVWTSLLGYLWWLSGSPHWLHDVGCTLAISNHTET